MRLTLDRPATNSVALSLWRNPNFLKLWAGQSVSVFGDQIAMVALPLTAALTLQADPF